MFGSIINPVLDQDPSDRRPADAQAQVRVASHVRKFAKGGFTTIPEHMPKRTGATWSERPSG